MRLLARQRWPGAKKPPPRIQLTCTVNVAQRAANCPTIGGWVGVHLHTALPRPRLYSLAPEAAVLSIGAAGPLTRERRRSAGGEDTQSKGKAERRGESCVQALGLLVSSLRSGVWFCLICFQPEPVPRSLPTTSPQPPPEPHTLRSLADAPRFTTIALRRRRKPTLDQTSNSRRKLDAASS
jgi:hypothetical protein